MSHFIAEERTEFHWVSRLESVRHLNDEERSLKG